MRRAPAFRESRRAAEHCGSTASAHILTARDSTPGADIRAAERYCVPVAELLADLGRAAGVGRGGAAVGLVDAYAHPQVAAASGGQPALGRSALFAPVALPAGRWISPWALQSFRANVHLNVFNNSYGRMYI